MYLLGQYSFSIILGKKHTFEFSTMYQETQRVLVGPFSRFSVLIVQLILGRVQPRRIVTILSRLNQPQDDMCK